YYARNWAAKTLPDATNSCRRSRFASMGDAASPMIQLGRGLSIFAGVRSTYLGTHHFGSAEYAMNNLECRKSRVCSKLWLQSLEDRTVPTTFTVTNLNDSGAGSLRAQITAANGNPGDDTVNFSVFGAITLTTGELTINDGVVIAGPSIVVNGNNASRVFNT